MTDTEKVEWAKQAFAEISRDCEEIGNLEIVDKMERRTWRAIAKRARRNIEILNQK